MSKSFSSFQAWIYFGFKTDGEGKTKDSDRPTCCLCIKRVLAKGGNTSNLLSHLHVHHPSKFDEVKKQQKEQSQSSSSKPKQPTIIDAVQRTRKHERNWRKWKQLTDSVTYFLAKNMLPLYTVKKEGFKKLIRTLDPQMTYQATNISPRLQFQPFILRLGRKF